jgi:hypothetical protein
MDKKKCFEDGKIEEINEDPVVILMLYFRLMMGNIKRTENAYSS